jgi:D-sedoheptulose 7-phosphate isomerase
MAHLELPALKPLVNRLKQEKRKIVFTNGCFDILHIGHIRYLQEARQLGDALIVGINKDTSVAALKGKGRPIIPFAERAEIVAALKCVDYTIGFDEPSPDNLIREISPDFHVKGGDYNIDKLPEANLVRALGGREVIVNMVEGYSTTRLIRNILDHYGKPAETIYSTLEKRTYSNVCQQVIDQLQENINIKKAMIVSMPEKISRAAEMVTKAYQDGKKLLLIGNGGSTDDAQHIAGEFVGRFKLKRPGLPAIPLTTSCFITAIGNDFGFESIFARQIEAYAEAGDVLIAISTSGKSPNVLRAIEAARLKSVKTIALTGGSGGEMKDRADLALVVPSFDTPRIQEAHIAMGHIICQVVEESLRAD